MVFRSACLVGCSFSLTMCFMRSKKFLESFEATFGIAAAVKVNYKNQGKVLITNKEAIDAKSFDGGPFPDFVVGQPEVAIAAAKHVVSSINFSLR